MLVRPAEQGDLGQILEILNREILEGVAHFGTEPQTLTQVATGFANRGALPWAVAQDEVRVLGFARASPWKARGAYRWTVEVGTYVRPELQGQGVGRAIFEAFVPMLSESGVRTVLAGIALPNPASVRLHEAFGFQHVGTLPRVGWKLGAWHDVGYWTLNFGEADEPPMQ